MNEWEHLVVHTLNKGRKIYENGVLKNSHTKKADMKPLPRKMWNAKGKKMINEAKGDMLNHYGKKGWELVAVTGPEGENADFRYFFKRTSGK